MAWGSNRPSVGYTDRERNLQLKRFPVCQLHHDGCTHKATEVHHVVGRAKAGKHIGGRNLISVCHTCHDVETQNDAVEARDDWKRKPEKHPGVLD